jgi:predicted DNA-binding transcriptional regulator YafY
LFQLIQILRRHRGAVTADRLSRELEVSHRTVYRDVADLAAKRVPIRGEPGVGYTLDAGYDMPPLMLTPDEIEAAVLGAQWVAARGDATLARGAADLVAKIEAVLPRNLRHIALEAAVVAAIERPTFADGLDLGKVRQWIRERRKLRFCYTDEAGRRSERVIWPIAAAYFESMRLIAGWCETRKDFRHFRTDRIEKAEFLLERVPRSAKDLLAEWRASEIDSNRGKNRRSTGKAHK